MKSLSFDVVVIGGGPAGLCAAIAAARAGSRCALVERHPCLGGMGTTALVNNFCNAYYDGQRYIIDGIFGEIRGALIARNALYETNGLEPYNHHAFCEIVDELCKEVGVEVFTGEFIEEIELGESSVKALRSGRYRFFGKTFVDASGDAVLAAGSGVPFLKRSGSSRKPMPLTYCYVMGPVDLDIIKRDLPEAIFKDLSGNEYVYFGGQNSLRGFVSEARKTGELTIPRDRIAVAYSIPGSPENISVNFGRVVIDDPTDREQLVKAEELGKKQVEEGLRFFRKYVPGCRNVQLVELARQIGVRESRQIHGRYCLTREDVLNGRQFDDVIAQCRYAIDIHDPEGDGTTMIHLPPGSHYDIPLRSLLPVKGPRNLIVAGRSISATQEAMSSFRVSPSVMAIGEAAGVCASLAAQADGDVAAIPSCKVQQVLLKGNAILS